MQSIETHSALPAALALLVAACSSPAPKPDPAPASGGSSKHEMVNPLVAAAGGDDEGDGLQVEGVLGTIDDEAVRVGLAPRLSAAAACFHQRVRNQPYLGGKLTLVFRVSRQGAVKKLKLSQSTLGSAAVERCIMRGFAGVRFARPRGGEAEFVYPLSFPCRVPSLSWDPGMVKDEILKNVDSLLQDAEGDPMTAPAGLTLTLYIDGKGRVVSTGMTAADVVDEAFADRLITNLEQLQFVAPDGGYAKVTYTW